MLAIWFEQLGGYPIEKYYEKIRKQEWKIEGADVIKFFPDQKTSKSEFDLSTIQINFIERGGISITNDFMSKIFIEDGAYEAFK